MDLATRVGQRRMTYEQMGAVVDKYMADHPADWGHEMALTVMNAFFEVCNIKK